MKKGFTMIEILAVFTITALILIVSVPFITGLLKKGDNEAYKDFKDTVFIAAEAYIQDEGIVVTQAISTITIGDLVNSNYLKSTLVNPNNNKKVLDEVNKQIIIKVNKDDENILNFEIEGEKK